MSRDKKTPMAFLSYVRFEDQHNDGRLSEFRERLSVEVRAQTGDEFPIFQDRNDIKWGQNWQERIEDSIDKVTFLIPIITPSFFNSPPCRSELESFLKREKELNRNDLILPVYYIDTPVLNIEDKRAKDNLAKIIAERQLADWRELRFEPFTSPILGKTLAKLATQIRDALERTEDLRKPKPKPAPRKKQGQGKRAVPPEDQSVSESSETTQRPTTKNEPPTIIVDQLHRGNYTTITEAINNANPGDRILVRPGLYKEGIVIDKPLEIIGEGDLGDVIIEAGGKTVLRFRTNMSRVSNLTLRQTGGGNYFCVDITQGRPELEGCDITSQTQACVGIHNGADPRLRRNRIHNGKYNGVYVYENGQGTLEDNEIFSNEYSGVSIATGGNPSLRRNQIHDNKQSGVYIYDNGQGTLEYNTISGNSTAGVIVSDAGNPVVRHNQINKNQYEAIWVYKGGAGTFEDNDLRDNVGGAWSISEDSAAKVKRARN
jgi:parallel beta-helix repeat protein